jgi:hypothetical protein
MKTEPEYKTSDFIIASSVLWIMMFIVAWLAKTNGLG